MNVLLFALTAESAKTKSVDGNEHPAADFAYVGNAEDISTWSLPDFDEAHVRDALGRLAEDKVVPESEKKTVARRLAAKAKKHGIDASGFRQAHQLSSEADLSLDEQQSLISAALRTQFGLDLEGCSRFYLYETFNDYVITRGPNGCLYRIPYTISDEEVTFGDAQEVTTAYVPVAESYEFIAAEASTEAVSGKYPIVALKAGWGNGAVNGKSAPHYYPAAFVGMVAESLNGKPFGRRHPDQRSSDPTGSADPDRIAGWLEGGTLDGDKALTTVSLFTAESELRSKLDEARDTKTIGNFAVSMLASIGYKAGVVDGKQCLIAESLGTLYSVDLCARAGAGGQFLTAASLAVNDAAARQLQAVNPQSPVISPVRGNSGSASGASEGASMKNAILQLLEALRQKNPARCAELSLKFATVAEGDYSTFMGTVTTALAEAPAPTAGTPVLTAEAAAATLAEAHRVQSRTRIETSLTSSKLPKPAQDLARGHLEAMLTTEADLPQGKIDAEITSVRTAFAAISPVGRIHPASSVTLDSADKMSLAMEAALGVKESLTKGVPAFRGFQEAYKTITGDWNLDRLRAGTGFGLQLTSEAVVTGDFPNILLNSMTKRLLQDWAELALDGLSNLYTKASISDYKVQDRVREGFFPELAMVSENVAYQEITYPTDELVTYQMAKYGNLLSISEETIRNDDLGAIARFPGRLARAGRWTLKNFITNFFKNNPNYTGDSVAWFASGHNNLGSVALSQDALITAEISLMQQTEKDSGEPLGLPLQWLMVPAALAATARQINQTNTAGSNAFYQRFGVNNERIFVNEKLSDATDWYYGTNQENAPFLEIGFLDGIENPQIFLANQPTVGTQFTADTLQYKVKFPFSGAIIDFRGVGKNVVAG